MKAFGYRKLRLGLTPWPAFNVEPTSGESRTASGWQRATVGLMGGLAPFLISWCIIYATTRGVFWEAGNPTSPYLTLGLLLAIVGVADLVPINHIWPIITDQNAGDVFFDVVLFCRWPALHRAFVILIWGCGTIIAALKLDPLSLIIAAVCACFTVYHLRDLGKHQASMRISHALRAESDEADLEMEVIPEELLETLAVRVEADLGPRWRSKPNAKALEEALKTVWRMAAIPPTRPVASVALLVLYSCLIFGGMVCYAGCRFINTYTAVDVPATATSPQVRTVSIKGATVERIEVDVTGLFHGEFKMYDDNLVGTPSVIEEPEDRAFVLGQFVSGMRHGTWQILNTEGGLQAEAVFDRGIFQSARLRAGDNWTPIDFEALHAMQKGRAYFFNTHLEARQVNPLFVQ